jgi:hypothetical protein
MFNLSDTQTGTDSCLIKELSQIKLKDSYFIFPEYFLDDFYAEYFEDKKINYEIKDHQIYVCNNNITLSNLQSIRYKAYSATVWYPELKDYTFDSKLYFIGKKGYEKNIRKLNIEFPKFIKLDNVSAKDIDNDGIYENMDQLIDTFKKSERIQNSLTDDSYLFVREIYKNLKRNIELRCFIYHSKLTAISCNEFIKDENSLAPQTKEKIINTVKDFINSLILPYNDVTIDILYPDLKIIECNSFGADMPCGSGRFNWSEDFLILHSDGTNVEFRCLNEFEF